MIPLAFERAVAHDLHIGFACSSKTPKKHAWFVMIRNGFSDDYYLASLACRRSRCIIKLLTLRFWNILNRLNRCSEFSYHKQKSSIVRFCFFRVLLAEQEETLEAKFLKRNPPRKSMTVCHEGQSMIESSFTSEDAAEIGADKEEEVKEEGEEKEGSKTPHACLNCNREFNLCNLISTRLSHLHS